MASPITLMIWLTIGILSLQIAITDVKDCDD